MKKIRTALAKAQLRAAAKLASLRRDEKGIDIIVMIVVLAILIAIAAIFREELTNFVTNLFGQITSF